MSSSTLKKIQINPSLFNVSKGRTKTEKKRPIIQPIINPNMLKKQFLNDCLDDIQYL